MRTTLVVLISLVGVWFLVAVMVGVSFERRPLPPARVSVERAERPAVTW